jgi:hypothetical protein
MARRQVFKRDDRSNSYFRPTTQDLRAVEDVRRFRLLTGTQLLQLHWRRPTQRRHGESRLRELFHAGWLDRQPYADGLGRPRAVYSVGRLGRLHLAEKLGLPLSQVEPRPAAERRNDFFFLRHHLQTVQVVIHLQLAAERRGGAVVHFREERALRADWARYHLERRVIPDAFVVLAVGTHVQSFCLELDRATVDRRAWQHRIVGYSAWAKTDTFRQELRSPVVFGGGRCPCEARSASRR